MKRGKACVTIYANIVLLSNMGDLSLSNPISSPNCLRASWVQLLS